MARKWKYGGLCLVAVLLVVIIALQPSQATHAYVLPNLKLPYASSQNGITTWNGGPHMYGDTRSQSIVPKAYASGLDFGGHPYDSSCLSGGVYYCGYSALAMASGTVTFMGLGGLGNMVAVQLDGSSVTLIYGHLYDYDNSIKTPYLAGQTVHVNIGDKIGRVGGTGPSGNKEWAVHLHVELRDGTTCSNHCIPAKDIRTNQQLSGVAGNPLPWAGEMINGYNIYAYCVNSSCDNIYSYDGVAVKSFWGAGPPPPYTHFSFVDYEYNVSPAPPPQQQNNVFVWGLPPALTCSGSGEDCESSWRIPSGLAPYVKYTGHGLDGGGGTLDSTNFTSSGGGGGGQTGNSAVDIFENTNYGATQYGWDSPTNGWVNVPDYMNDKTSSVQIDGGWSILVAKDANGSGATKCLVSSYTDLSGAYYDNSDPMTDTISSVNVFQDSTCGGAYTGTSPGDTVTFWVDPNYWNTHWGVHDPISGDLPNYLQNAVTSIGVTSGWSAVVYRNAGLGEGFTCFTGSDTDLSNDTMNDGYPVNDNIESVEVFHDSNCGGRLHAPTVGSFSPQVNSYHVSLTYNISGMAPGYSIHTDFGDGANFDMIGPAVNVPVTHDYAWGSYLIVVTVKGTDGVAYPYSVPITVSPPPTATPTPTPSPTPTPIPTSVTTTVNSFNPNTGVLNYTLNWTGVQNVWNQCVFGDGPTQHVEYLGNQVNKVDGHSYPVGNFTFTCTVAGLNNNKYVQSRLNTMVGAGQPTSQLPVVTVNAVVQPNRTVLFTVIISNAKSNVNHVLAYGSGQGSSNAFGNGTKTFTKSYPAAGTYNVTMTVYGLNNITYVLNQQLVIP